MDMTTPMSMPTELMALLTWEATGVTTTSTTLLILDTTPPMSVLTGLPAVLTLEATGVTSSTTLLILEAALTIVPVLSMMFATLDDASAVAIAPARLSALETMTPTTVPTASTELVILGVARVRKTSTALLISEAAPALSIMLATPDASEVMMIAPARLSTLDTTSPIAVLIALTGLVISEAAGVTTAPTMLSALDTILPTIDPTPDATGVTMALTALASSEATFPTAPPTPLRTSFRPASPEDPEAGLELALLVVLLLPELKPRTPSRLPVGVGTIVVRVPESMDGLLVPTPMRPPRIPPRMPFVDGAMVAFVLYIMEPLPVLRLALVTGAAVALLLGTMERLMLGRPERMPVVAEVVIALVLGNTDELPLMATRTPLKMPPVAGAVDALILGTTEEPAMLRQPPIEREEVA